MGRILDCFCDSIHLYKAFTQSHRPEDGLSITVISLGGKNNHPLFYVSKSSVKCYCCPEHAYIVLGCISFTFYRMVDAFKANFLKQKKPS